MKNLYRNNKSKDPTKKEKDSKGKLTSAIKRNTPIGKSNKEWKTKAAKGDDNKIKANSKILPMAFTSDRNKIQNYNDSLTLNKGSLARLNALQEANAKTSSEYNEALLGVPFPLSFPAYTRLAEQDKEPNPWGLDFESSYTAGDAKLGMFPEPTQPYEYRNPDIQHVQPKKLPSGSDERTINKKPRQGVPKTDLPTVIGYKQVWNPKTKKYDKEEVTRVVPSRKPKSQAAFDSYNAKNPPKKEVLKKKTVEVKKKRSPLYKSPTTTTRVESEKVISDYKYDEDGNKVPVYSNIKRRKVNK